jgi:SsrA-binding protein
VRQAPCRYNPGVAKQGTTPVITNRKAFHDYFVDEELEAGIVLHGCEVKMIRRGSFELRDAYAEIKDGEAWLIASHIPEYPQAGTHIAAPDPNRRRKLLLHKPEIKRLLRKVLEKGFTLIPLKAYFHQGKVKLSIGLVKGKKSYDKRETIKERDVQREHERFRE